MVSSALATVYQQLTAFAGLDSFWVKFESVFGTEYDLALAESLRSHWQLGDFGQLPPIEVVSGDILGNARGAYAESRNTIYLADWFVAGATADVVGTVILEEIGHFVDAQVNAVDTSGDEGEYFAQVVLGQPVSQTEVSRLQAENDWAVVTVDGGETAIEQNAVVYEHADYNAISGGASVLYTPFDHVSIVPSLDNNITSIDIEDGYVAELYEHSFFGGSRLVLSRDQKSIGASWDDPNPAFRVHYYWNDRVSSIKVRRMASNEVIIYEHGNYQGVGASLLNLA